MPNGREEVQSALMPPWSPAEAGAVLITKGGGGWRSAGAAGAEARGDRRGRVQVTAFMRTCEAVWPHGEARPGLSGMIGCRPVQ